MNYLAHAFLSPSDPLILLGNMACDMIHPDDAVELPDQVKAGMDLHQKIDRYTDRHEGFKIARDLLNRVDLPYAGVLTDIIFDHFLARDWKNYSNQSLIDFSASVYEILELSNTQHTIPGNFSRLASALVSDNWFKSYTTEQGLEKALLRLNYRSSRDIPVLRIIEAVRKESLILTQGFNKLFTDQLSIFPHAE